MGTSLGTTTRPDAEKAPLHGVLMGFIATVNSPQLRDRFADLTGRVSEIEEALEFSEDPLEMVGAAQALLHLKPGDVETEERIARSMMGLIRASAYKCCKFGARRCGSEAPATLLRDMCGYNRLEERLEFFAAEAAGVDRADRLGYQERGDIEYLPSRVFNYACRSLSQLKEVSAARKLFHAFRDSPPAYYKKAIRTQIARAMLQVGPEATRELLMELSSDKAGADAYFLPLLGEIDLEQHGRENVEIAGQLLTSALADLKEQELEWIADDSGNPLIENSQKFRAKLLETALAALKQDDPSKVKAVIDEALEDHAEAVRNAARDLSLFYF